MNCFNYLFNIISRFSASLNEHDVELLRLAVAVFGGDLALVRQVRLVAHQHDDHVGPTLRAHVVDPFRCLVE